MKDLVGAFASTARLPKMLNRKANFDTLLRGCEAGDFVLQVTRGDKSTRTFWKSRPDEYALVEPSLEVVLPDAATLTDIDPALLTFGTLPNLWQGESIKIGALQQYFSGKHHVQIDKGGYKEAQSIPGASGDAVKQAVSAAIKARRLWLLGAGISAFGDDVPASLITDAADLYSPPAQVEPTDLLPAKLPAAWAGTETTAHTMHVALSGLRGRTLPWVTVEAALDHAFRLGLLERTVDSKDWPTDLGGAAGVKIRVSKVDTARQKDKGGYGGKIAEAELETNEIQDLAEQVAEMKKAAAGQKLRFKVTVEVGEAGSTPQGVLDAVNALLAKVKKGWKLGA